MIDRKTNKPNFCEEKIVKLFLLQLEVVLIFAETPAKERDYGNKVTRWSDLLKAIDSNIANAFQM